MSGKKKAKGKVVKKGEQKLAATKKVGGGDAPKSAEPKTVKGKGGKRIFITTQVDATLKAKLQAAADKEAGKPGASLAAYCREILAGTVAAG